MKKSFRHNIIFDFSVAGATRGGVYVFAQNLIEELGKTDEVDLQVFQSPFSSINKKGIRRKVSSFLRLLYREILITYTGKGKIFFFPIPEVPLLLLLFCRNYIVTIHDLYAWKNKRDTTFFARLTHRILPWIARRAWRICTVSEFSKEDIVRHLKIPEDKIYVVSNGLNEVFLQHHQYALPDFPYLLNVGALEPRKNIPFLIEVFNQLKQKGYKRLKLCLTGGESWNEAVIFDKITASPYRNDIQVLRHIPIATLPELYQNALALVFPSVEEGFGIPVIEALSQGTPVLVNKNSALQYFDSFGATVIANYNPQAWVSELEFCIENQTRVSPQHITQVKQTFTWANAAQSFISMLKKG